MCFRCSEERRSVSGSLLSIVFVVLCCVPAVHSQVLSGPRVTSVGFTESGDFQVTAEVPPGYRHAVLEVVPEGGDPAVWQSLVSGPMTGASGTVRFTLP